MARAPRGNILANTASLPDWSIADVPTHGETEADRIRTLYRCAIAAHFKAAAARVSRTSEVDESERAYSRRVLTFNWGPYAETRAFLCEHADIDEKEVRRMALAALTPLMEAERAAERAVEPEPPKLAARTLSADEFLAYVIANESGLEEVGELEIAIEHSAALELERMTLSRADEHFASRAKRYSETEMQDFRAA